MCAVSYLVRSLECTKEEAEEYISTLSDLNTKETHHDS